MRVPSFGWTLITAQLLFGGALQAQLGTTERSLPSRQQLSRYGLELEWWGQAVMNPSRDKVSHLSADEDCVFVQSSGGVITAFDAETGQRRWAIQLGQFDPPSFQVVTNESQAMVVVGSHMYGLDKHNGKTLWSLRLPGQASTSPAADAKRAYVGMLDGSLYAFDLQKIQQLFKEDRLPEWSHVAIDWRYTTSKEISSPPLIFGSRLCMASRDGNVYAVTTDRRQLVFQFETDAPIVAPIARLDDILYLTSEDYSFYALRVRPDAPPLDGKKAGAGAVADESVLQRDKESGKVIWEFTSGLPIRKAPYPIGQDLYVLPERGGLYSLDSRTGDQRWWQPQGIDYVATSNQHVYATDDDGNLLVLSRQGGNILGAMPLRRFTKRFANDRTDRIVISTESGLVVVLREKGKTIPTFHMHPDRLPLLPEFAPAEGEAPAEEMPAEGESDSGT